jgi:hypothetical protein
MAKPKTKTKPKHIVSKATRLAMSRAHTGLKISPAAKAKISAARKEREALIEAGLLKPFRHSDKTKKLLRKLAKARKQKPGRKALKAAALEKRNRAADKALAKRVTRGDFG